MTTPVQDLQSKEDDKAHNFEQLRKKLEASEREKNAAQAKLIAFEREITEAQNKKYKEPSLEEDHYDEPYVDEKRLNKKFASYEEKFDKKIEERATSLARQMIEQERNATFLKQNPDFNQILSPEIIDKFAHKHPEIAEPMLEMPEGFARQKLLYQNIKALKIHVPDSPAPTIQETIDKNRRSPFYQPSGVGSAPYGNNGDFTDVGQKSAYDKVKQLRERLRL